MIEDIHPQSKIGTARSKLAALRSRAQPLEERLTAHKAERLQKQTLVERATLDTPPIEVAMAESRIRLLEQAITRETNELAPLVQQRQTAERDLAALEHDLEDKHMWLPDLQDVQVNDLQLLTIAGWMERLRALKQALQALAGEPLDGARYEPVVTVSWALLQPGEELPTLRLSAFEQRRQASVAAQHAADRQPVAELVGQGIGR